jgi:hypothetical protein
MVGDVTMDRLRKVGLRKKKDVVEDCWVLSVKDVRAGAGYRNGLFQLRCGDQDLGAIKFEINLRSAERGYPWLWYNVDGGANCVAISMTSRALHSRSPMVVHMPCDGHPRRKAVPPCGTSVFCEKWRSALGGGPTFE